jgi:hypothetical protein
MNQLLDKTLIEPVELPASGLTQQEDKPVKSPRKAADGKPDGATPKTRRRRGSTFGGDLRDFQKRITAKYQKRQMEDKELLDDLVKRITAHLEKRDVEHKEEEQEVAKLIEAQQRSAARERQDHDDVRAAVGVLSYGSIIRQAKDCKDEGILAKLRKAGWPV